MSDDNVISLPARELPENPIQMAEPALTFCQHASIIVDAHARTIHCADPKCGAALDAFDYLRDNARTLRTAWSNYRAVQAHAIEVACHQALFQAQEAAKMLFAKGEMLAAVVQGAREEFVRVPYGASHEDVAAINDWHKMAADALSAWENRS